MPDAPAPRGLQEYPPVWLALLVAAAVALGQVAPHGGPVWTALGIALCGAGAALMGAAAWTMWRGRATLMPTSRPTAMVTHGVYAASRNPIYLADALILAGVCLIAAPLAAVVLVPAFVAIVTARFIRREEAWLRDRDPAGFAAYAARTRRWL